MTWSQILYLLPIVPAAVLALSDLRHRSIPVGWLIAFGSCVLLAAAFLSPVRTILHNVLTNILLLGWMFGGVWLYLRLRYRNRTRSFGRYIGSGDVWFVLLLMPLFPLTVYIVLLLSGFAAGLLYGTAVRLVARRTVTIPLVSALGVAFIVYAFHCFYTWPS
jgi:hypothetical protein